MLNAHDLINISSPKAPLRSGKCHLTHLSNPAGVRSGRFGLWSSHSWTRWCWYSRSLYSWDIDGSSANIADESCQRQKSLSGRWEHTWPRVWLIHQLDVFIVLYHLYQCDDRVYSPWSAVYCQPLLTLVTLRMLNVQCALPALTRVDQAWLWSDHLCWTAVPISSLM